MDAEIQHKDGQFDVSIDSHESVLLYKMLSENNVDFYRTFVPDELRGRGVAARLVNAGLDWAQEQAFTVTPSCSYVEKLVQRRNKA